MHRSRRVAAVVRFLATVATSQRLLPQESWHSPGCKHAKLPASLAQNDGDWILAAQRSPVSRARKRERRRSGQLFGRRLQCVVRRGRPPAHMRTTYQASEPRPTEPERREVWPSSRACLRRQSARHWRRSPSPLESWSRRSCRHGSQNAPITPSGDAQFPAPTHGRERRRPPQQARRAHRGRCMYSPGMRLGPSWAADAMVNRQERIRLGAARADRRRRATRHRVQAAVRNATLAQRNRACLGSSAGV